MKACPFKAEAKRLGQKIYFGGTPCPHNHVLGRYATDGAGVACRSLKSKRGRITPEGKIQRVIVASRARAKKFGYVPLDPMTIRPYPEDNRCELCGNFPKTGRLHADHNHITGAFRGWADRRCNTMLGSIDMIGPGRITEYVQGLVYELDHPK